MHTSRVGELDHDPRALFESYLIDSFIHRFVQKEINN